jgi:predicted nucleic acid-binding protein
VDTDVLIDLGKGDPVAGDRVRREAAIVTPAISVVSQLELLAGVRDKSELRQIIRSLKRFTIVKLDPPICDRAVALLERYRLSHGLLMADGLVAATALNRGYTLLTKNRKDYQFIKGMMLAAYP